MAETKNSMLDFGGLLFGGGDSGLKDYLTAEQQKQMQSQAMMQAAMSLLKSGRTTTTPIGIGEALGSAYEAGTAGYQGAQTNAIQQLLTKQKLDEFKREQALQNFFTSRIPGFRTGAATTPSLDATAPTTTEQPVLTDGSTPMLPATSITNKPRPDIFSTLTPDQLVLAAMSPKTMLPKVFEESLKTESFNTLTPTEVTSLGLDPSGKYQQNIRTGQITSIQAPKEEFEVVTGVKAEALGLSGLGKWQVNKTTKQATQVAETPGTFGGGLQGKAYDIILESVNSGKTDTLAYALAHRELSKPVPMEQVQPDGSIKTVYTQPAPLPSTIPKPTYRGNIPQATTQTTVVPAVAGQVTAAKPSAATKAAPVVAATGETGIAPGVKSTPFAPTAGQVGEARKQILVADKLVSAINLLETDVNQNGLQIGGLGQAGGRQEALFQDAILQLKELQNLGVLNGPDERILLQQLADPTSLKSYIKGLGGPEYVLSKITELRNKANREIEMINKQFPQSVSTPKTKPETPSEIKEILKIYPPAPRKK
jgi:hypothetical protein